MIYGTDSSNSRYNYIPMRGRRHEQNIGAQPQIQSSVSPASDIYTCIEPVLCVHKALGLACFSLRKENNSTTLQYSSRGAVYNLFVIALALAAVYLTNLGNLSQTYDSQSLITSINDAVQLNLPFFLMIVVLIRSRSQTRIISLFTKLMKCDKMLKNINVDIPHKKNQRFLINQITIDILVIVEIICFGNICLFVLVKSDNLWGLLLGIDVLIVINHMFENQCFAWWFALRQRFQLLNTRMREPTPVDGVLVQAFAVAQSALCDVAQEVNAVFSIQLLANVAACFVDILLNVFYVVRTMIIYSNSEKDSVFMIIFEIHISLLAIFKIAFVCIVCSIVANEANSSAFIVHDMMKNNTHKLFKKDLKAFSLQLLHQKVCFTACGFFPLDFSLAFTIVATATTYIIILLQFDKDALSPPTFNNVTTGTS